VLPVIPGQDLLPSYAQWGEDKLVWDYFRLRPNGIFIEVGANDPIKLSQTWFLEQNGWEGILVEPQPARCERLRQVRQRSRVFQCACGRPEQRGKASFRVAVHDDRSALAGRVMDPTVAFSGTIEVDVLTLDDVLAQCGNPKPDFISIDVEGAELDVFKGFDLARHQPGLLLVEDDVFDLRLHSYLRARNYKLVRRTGSNNWYVPKTTDFPLSPRERLRLFRKMRLGTPLRRLKRALRND
jgi:FkbM family methyltransferase